MNPRSFHRVTLAIRLTLALFPFCFVVGIPFIQRPEQPTLDVVDDLAAPRDTSLQTQPRIKVA